MSRTALLNLLCMVQNSAENHNRDIMTIAGMCDDLELVEHLFGEMNRLKDAGRKASILASARTYIAA